MTTEPNSSSTEASIRKLTSSVRFLGIVMVLNIIATIVLGLAPSIFARKVNQQLATNFSEFSGPSVESFNSFHSWPLEKQVQASSVILRTEFEKSDTRMKCIIREIIKQNPETKFYYKIGDEYHGLGMSVEKDTSYGDGQIAFFVGSPADFRYSTSYSNNRLSGMGGMSLEEFRQLVKTPATKRP